MGLVKKWQIEKSNTLTFVSNLTEIKDFAVARKKLGDDVRVDFAKLLLRTLMNETATRYTSFDEMIGDVFTDEDGLYNLVNTSNTDAIYDSTNKLYQIGYKLHDFRDYFTGAGAYDDTGKGGIRIQTKSKAIKIKKVYLMGASPNDCTATKCYICDDSDNVIASASVTDYVATFDPEVELSANTYYRIYADSEGATYQVAYRSVDTMPDYFAFSVVEYIKPDGTTGTGYIYNIERIYALVGSQIETIKLADTNTIQYMMVSAEASDTSALLCDVSPDGTNWITDQPLDTKIDVSSYSGTTPYVRIKKASGEVYSDVYAFVVTLWTS